MVDNRIQITEHLTDIDEKANAIVIWRRSQRINGVEVTWIVIVTVEVRA